MLPFSARRLITQTNIVQMIISANLRLSQHCELAVLKIPGISAVGNLTPSPDNLSGPSYIFYTR